MQGDAEVTQHQDAATFVGKFIASSGFPLESAVGSRLHGAGFVPRHGRTYEAVGRDGQPKLHEIDIAADLWDQRLPIPVRVVVECKAARRCHWVVIKGDADPQPAVLPIHHQGGVMDMHRITKAVRHALHLEPPHAFAVHQARGEKDKAPDEDPAFRAIQQAVSGAAGATWGADELIVYPVVVIEGGLWLYEFGKGVESITQARLVWWNSLEGHAVPVDVVTRGAVEGEYPLELRETLVALSEAIHAVPRRPTASFA